MQIRVDISTQTLSLFDDCDALVEAWPISTSQYGIGFEPGSYKTPLGRFLVSEKFGDNAPIGEIFVSRKPTGRIGIEGEEGDHVQTRILWLEGIDPENANTKSRYIYIHGTNWEQRIGTPASHGCIRMRNQDIIKLYDLVPIETLVVITK